jgi:hypothetical protein
MGALVRIGAVTLVYTHVCNKLIALSMMDVAKFIHTSNVA